MRTNLEEHVKETPVSYQHEVTKPLTCRTDVQKCSVAEEANYYDLPPILARIAKALCANEGSKIQ